jgi:hypothetical protein
MKKVRLRASFTCNSRGGRLRYVNFRLPFLSAYLFANKTGSVEEMQPILGHDLATFHIESSVYHSAIRHLVCKILDVVVNIPIRA